MGTETDDLNTAAEANELSLRDQLDAAFDASEGTDDPPAPAPAPANAPSPAPAPTEQPEDTGAQARDQHGRFAPKWAQPAAPAQQGTQQPPQGAQGAQAAQPPEPKPPASWRPEAREKWGSVDPEIRREVTRREHEMQTVLQDSAAAKQFVNAFESVVRPYEMFIRADGANPLQAVQNLMQTAADLRVGTPSHKANIVASIIQNFGIDVEMLDGVLAQMRQGGAIPQAGQQQQQFRDPRVDMLIAQQQQALQMQSQQAEQSQRAELDAFAADPKHEFYRDVAGIMADLVEIWTRQNKPIDLEKIYAQACQMHDSIPTIIATRAQQQKAAGNAQAVLRAKRAAASVKGESTPAGATVPKDDSIRASIEAAMNTLSDI